MSCACALCVARALCVVVFRFLVLASLVFPWGGTIIILPLSSVWYYDVAASFRIIFGVHVGDDLGLPPLAPLTLLSVSKEK
jgi:hypothetical protein